MPPNRRDIGQEKEGDSVNYSILICPVSCLQLLLAPKPGVSQKGGRREGKQWLGVSVSWPLVWSLLEKGYET